MSRAVLSGVRESGSRLLSSQLLAVHDAVKEPKSLKDFYIVAARRAHIPDIYTNADTPLILVPVEIDGEVTSFSSCEIKPLESSLRSASSSCVKPFFIRSSLILLPISMKHSFQNAARRVRKNAACGFCFPFAAFCVFGL